MSGYTKSVFQPAIIALCALVILSFGIHKYLAVEHGIKEKSIRDNLLGILISKKSQLEKSLYSRIYYTKGVAAYCSANPDLSGESFHVIAAELIQKDSVIRSMSLAKNCVINAIYPYKGQESVIGLDLLKHPARRKIVEMTIKTRQTFVAGPVELIEGGIAFISYTPIFAKEGGRSRFWGVTDIVILKDQLFGEIGLVSSGGEYNFALKGIDGTGINGDCFWGDAGLFNQKPVLVDINLPTGNWALAGVPAGGWYGYDNKEQLVTILLYSGAIIISLLIWLLARATMKIRTNEKELEAMFGAMQDLVIQVNSKGIYVKIAPTNENLLFRPAPELLGKSLYEIFDKEKADFFMAAIKECLQTKEMVTRDFPLVINDKQHWFHARLCYLNEDAVIYVAEDNTEQMNVEQRLKESREKLIELNAAKDKFFSILAHDLKGPFMGFIGISEELSQNADTMERKDIVELSAVINSSAKRIYSLLNNLLEWSRLQTGRMTFLPQLINLRSVTEACLNLFESALKQKNISVINEVSPGINIFADMNMYDTIIRNIISNAIKFTPAGGTIKMNSCSDEGTATLVIEDSGIGMKPEVLEKVFRIDSGYTTKGTEGEEGTGLGLILCRELVEKNGGRFDISSIDGKGTRISVSFLLTNNDKN